MCVFAINQANLKWLNISHKYTEHFGRERPRTIKLDVGEK